MEPCLPPRAEDAPGLREIATTPDLVYALVLLQGGFGVLASFGTVMLMGSPVYLAMPVMTLAAMLFLAVKAAHGQRWAIITTIIFQSVALAEYALSALIGLLPAVTFTFNLVGLITGLAMPATVIWLCARLLKAAGKARPVAHGAARETNPSAAQTLIYTGRIGPPR